MSEVRNQTSSRGHEKLFRNVVGPESAQGAVKWSLADREPPIAHLTNTNLEVYLAMCWENESKPHVLLGKKWLNLLVVPKCRTKHKYPLQLKLVGSES